MPGNSLEEAARQSAQDVGFDYKLSKSCTMTTEQELSKHYVVFKTVCKQYLCKWTSVCVLYVWQSSSIFIHFWKWEAVCNDLLWFIYIWQLRCSLWETLLQNLYILPSSFPFLADVHQVHHHAARPCHTLDAYTQSDWPVTNCTCTPGSHWLSGCQPASLFFVSHWMFLGQVWTMCPLSPAGSPSSLPRQSRWRGKYQEEDKKPEISLKGSEAFGWTQNAKS